MIVYLNPAVLWRYFTDKNDSSTVTRLRSVQSSVCSLLCAVVVCCHQCAVCCVQSSVGLEKIPSEARVSRETLRTLTHIHLISLFVVFGDVGDVLYWFQNFFSLNIFEK